MLDLDNSKHLAHTPYFYEFCLSPKSVIIVN